MFSNQDFILRTIFCPFFSDSAPAAQIPLFFSPKVNNQCIKTPQPQSGSARLLFSTHDEARQTCTYDSAAVTYFCRFLRSLTKIHAFLMVFAVTSHRSAARRVSRVQPRPESECGARKLRETNASYAAVIHTNFAGNPIRRTEVFRGSASTL